MKILNFIRDHQKGILTILIINFSFLSSCLKAYNPGDDYYNQAKKEEAIIEYEKYLKDNPNDVNSYEKLALIYIDKKEYKKAIEYLSKVITFDNNDSGRPMQYFKISESYINLNQEEDAIRTYNNALEYFRSYISYLQEKEPLYYQAYDKTTANNLVLSDRKAISVYYQWIKASNKRLGEIYMKQSKITDAIREYESALSYNKNDSEINLNLAKLYYQQNNLNKTISHLRDATQNDKSYKQKIYEENLFKNILNTKEVTELLK